MVRTKNIFGEITVTDEVIAKIAVKAALDTYGVASLANKNVKENFGHIIKSKKHNEIKIITNENRIKIELAVILKYGMSLNATCDAIKDSVKYKVESFTGMIVDSVAIGVMGVKN
jgi:uncharacterized alkaline shock family protein YloU